MSGPFNGSTTASSVEFECPLVDTRFGKLVVISGVPKLLIRSDSGMLPLLHAVFERPLPEINEQDGVVKIRYPSYSLLNWFVYWRQPKADITINPSVPWSIEVNGGVSNFEADLSRVQLSGLEFKGGISHLWTNLPEPVGTVTIQIGGGVSDMTIIRPADVPVRIQIRGGISSLTFDNQSYGSIGTLPQLESPGYQEVMNRYDIRISGGVSNIVITS